MLEEEEEEDDELFFALVPTLHWACMMRKSWSTPQFGHIQFSLIKFSIYEDQKS